MTSLDHLRPAGGSLIGALTAGAVGGLLTIAQAFALGTLLVRLVSDPGGDQWYPAAVWLSVVIVARAGVAYLGDVLSARAAGQVATALRRRLINATLEADAQALSAERSGALSLLLTRGVAATEPYLTRYLPTLVLAVTLPVATTATIFWLDWISGLVVVLTLPLVPMFAILIGLTTRDQARRQWRRLGALAGHFVDVVRGLPTLVAFRRADAQAGSIRRITDQYRRASIDTLRIAFSSSAVLELIATLSVALVAVEVGLRLAAGSLDFRTAMIVLLLAPEAYWPLRRVGAEFHAAAEGSAAFTEVDRLLDRPQDRQQPGGPGSSESQQPDSPALRGLTVRNLTVTYPGRTTPALSSVSLDLPATGLSAIVGPSGCGKSTLLQVLVGEVTAESGTVRLGEHDVADLADWRDQVAWAPQRPWLTSGTIAENLRFGRTTATEAELWSALRQVDLAQAVADLPHGLGTELGEDGAGLSAGQRARIALARVVLAVLDGRSWVLLDEPTAHLDSETERVLLRTLRWLAEHAAVVVVAHRTAVEEAADQVITLPAPPLVQVAPQPIDAVAPTRVGLGTEPTEAPSRWGRQTGLWLGAGSVASGVALTATASWLITRASEQPPVLLLMMAIVGVRLFGLARPVLRYAERLVSHDAALRLLAERRAEVYDALVPLVPGRLGRPGTQRGDLLASVVDDVDAVVDAELRVRQPWLTAVLVSVGVTVFALWLAPVAGLVIAVVCLIGLSAGVVGRAGAARAEADFVAARGRLSTRVAELLDGARMIVLWGAQDRFAERVLTESNAVAAAAQRSAHGMALGRAVPLVASGAGLITVALLVPSGAVGPATLALLVMLPVALVDVFVPLADAGAVSVRTRAATARLAALTDQSPAFSTPEESSPIPAASAPVSAHRLAAGWESVPAFTDLELRLEPGTRIGVVGPSGCGKSTLAAVLLRMVDPLAGEVRWGTTDTLALAPDEVRSHLSLVDDDPHIFSSTLVENVRLARPSATDDEVGDALASAHLGTWVQSLPQGLNTMLGDGYAAVSGGERARVGIARALLADSAVLVLDEPTAHLDTATANRIAAEVLDDARQRSVVWITHTNVGLDRVDDVVEINDETDNAVEGVAAKPRGIAATPSHSASGQRPELRGGTGP